MTKLTTTALCLAMIGMASAANIFTPGDFIIPIDYQSQSNSPGTGNEDPNRVIDGDGGTKYLNFGEENSGFIVTPGSGSSTIQSMTFITGNDSDERDPASYLLYGTNNPIASLNNSTGNRESWNLISAGGLSLPTARGATSSAFDFANGTSYTSYRLVFDSVRNAGLANSMQVAEVQFYSGLGGTGSAILMDTDAIIGIDRDAALGNSSTPGSGDEEPSMAIDGDNGTKYLNFGEEGSGFIITPSAGPSIVNEFSIVTANDSDERDPSLYTIYGTNDAITSAAHSNGDSENWTLIQAGNLSLPSDRNTSSGPISVTNGTAYTSYRVVFDGVKNEGLANSMQISEIQFGGTIIPEPSTGLLVLLGVGSLLRRRRK